MGMINTFGPIDWETYYRKPQPFKPLELLPCQDCGKTGRCTVVTDPDSENHCARYRRWVEFCWPIVTGKRKPPTELEPPKAAHDKTITPLL